MKEFTFNGQRADEEIEEIIKNHPFVLFWPGFKVVVLLAIPTLILIFWGANIFFSLATFICVLFAIAIFSRAYIEYSSSVFILTTQRVLNLEQKGFFKKKITETELNKIQDVTSDTDGVIKTSLGFGDLIVRTAGAVKGSEITAKNIASPYDIQQKITKMMG